MQTATALVSDEPVEYISILKPCFTPLANQLWDTGLMADLRHSELLVLLLIYRFTSGFQRAWCIIGETKILELTKLSASAFYEAKRELLRRGLIQVSHTKTGRCCYRLAHWLQPVRSEDDPATLPVQRVKANPSAQLEPYPSAPAQSCKDKKENIDHHHCSLVSEQTAPQLPQIPKPEPVVNDDVFLHSVSEVTDVPAQPEVNRSLVKQLQELGVTQFMAYGLAKKHSAEKIQAALARVKTIKPEKPAGYIVAELQRGGYGNAPVDKNKAIRESHEQLHERRKRERELEEQLKELKHEQTLTALEFFACLPTGDQASLRTEVDQMARAEGFCRIPHWSQEHPTYRGLLSELVRERYANVQRLHSGTG